MRTFYVWSTSPSTGAASLKGVPVQAETARKAVVAAVERELNTSGTCCLLGLVRVSLIPHGSDHRDVYFDERYEPFSEQFPELFDLFPDYETAVVAPR